MSPRTPSASFRRLYLRRLRPHLLPAPTKERSQVPWLVALQWSLPQSAPSSCYGCAPDGPSVTGGIAWGHGKIAWGRTRVLSDSLLAAPSTATAVTPRVLSSLRLRQLLRPFSSANPASPIRFPRLTDAKTAWKCPPLARRPKFNYVFEYLFLLAPISFFGVRESITFIRRVTIVEPVKLRSVPRKRQPPVRTPGGHSPFSSPAMYSSIISSILVSSVLSAGNVYANSPAALVVPIHRSLHKNKNPASVHSSSLPVCDVSKIKEQRANIVNKYHDVQERLFSSSIDFKDVIPPISAEEAEEPFIPAVITPELPLKDDISDNLDMLYFGDVYVGTPQQRLTFDVDTGSADFWMPVNCSECVNKQFEDTRSSTCKDSGEYVSVCYGSGEVSGALMQDKVSVAGLEVESFFIAVSELDGDFNGLPNDGLMGFAFSSISESRKPTFFETLVRSGMLPAPMFSVHLTRHQESGSSLCFGGIDNLKTLGPVQWIPVLKESYWSVSMDAIVVDENKEVTTDIIAIIDTGTTLIYLPDDVVSAFYELIPGARLSEIDSQLYIYPCITAPDINIALSFDNRRFSINPKDFNLGRTEEGSEDCVGGILSLGSGFPSDLAIIGDEFLKSWYTTFDYSGGPTGGARVGFSPSINNS